MQRILTTAAAVAVLACLGAAAYNFLRNPMEPRRAYLRDELARVPGSMDAYEPEPWRFDEWRGIIKEKESLWDALVPPPPPRPKPPPPPPKRPNVAKMMKGVQPTRRKIGDRIRILTPAEPGGILVGVGERVNGCALVSFDRFEAVFSFHWKAKGKDEDILHRIPRQ